MSSFWFSKYCEIKWEPLGRSFQGCDCWGLVWLVYKEELNINLPSFPIPPGTKAAHEAIHNGPKSGEWIELTEPEPFCIVAMSSRNTWHHVGLYIEMDGGLVLHAADYKKVKLDSLSSLKLKMYKRIGFFKYVSNH